jgi:hypothetical protein
MSFSGLPPAHLAQALGPEQHDIVTRLAAERDRQHARGHIGMTGGLGHEGLDRFGGKDLPRGYPVEHPHDGLELRRRRGEPHQ